MVTETFASSAAGQVHRLARGGVLSLVGSIANGLLGFFVVLVVARLLRPTSEAGSLFEVVALFTIISNIVELGADTGLVRMVAGHLAIGRPGDVRPTVWWAVVPMSIAAVAAAALLFGFAGRSPGSWCTRGPPPPLPGTCGSSLRCSHPPPPWWSCCREPEDSGTSARGW